MAKIQLNQETDGESASIGIKKAKESLSNLNARLDSFAGKKDLDPSECPDTMVPMLCGKNTRVACLTGNVYLFAKDTISFVHKVDADTCGGRGAVLQDAKAIAIRIKAAKDAEELAELRAEKLAAKAAVEKAAAEKAAAEKAAAEKVGKSDKK